MFDRENETRFDNFQTLPDPKHRQTPKDSENISIYFQIQQILHDLLHFSTIFNQLISQINYISKSRF